jgi:xylulokinase
VATLGIDLGTGSTKACLLDGAGRVLASASAPHPAAPSVDVELWWGSVVAAVRECTGGRPVTAIGLSGQMHGVVPLDSVLRPVGPAVTWASTAPPGEVAALAGPYLDSLGNPVVAGMPAVTLRSLPLDGVHLVVAPKDWLGARLTGVAVTDPTDASATLLWDLHADAWHAGFLAALGIDIQLLPEVRPSDEVRGGLLAGVAEELGLAAGTPVTVGRADVAAALIGAGVEQAMLSVGTGGQICRIVDGPRADRTRRTHLFRGPGPGQWYAMAATLSAGLALDWVRRLHGITWDELHEEAFTSPPGARGVTFRPYLAGERTPHLNPALSASWTGLRLHHGRPDALRAALEGSAFALRDAWDALRSADHGAGHDASTLVLAGGGTLDPRWRQLLADVLARPLAHTPHGGGSARGAALSAAVATGSFATLAEAVATAGAPRVITDPSPTDYTEPLARFRAVDRF